LWLLVETAIGYDVDFDLPEAFLPEFPPAIFLRGRPELGDVSHGEVRFD
jgi:hypothetical protein